MDKLPETKSKRKKLRLKLLKNAKPYDINPARRYERECEMVLRGLARFIEKSGFCPQAKVLAYRRTWLLEGTTQYLEDLLVMGMVEVTFGSTWNVTKAGWDTVGADPIPAAYPPEMVSKAESITEAKYLMRRMKDPEVSAAFDVLRKERHERQASPEA